VSRKELPTCNEIARACDILTIVLRVLYDSVNIMFLDVYDYDTLIWAVARKMLASQFGEPIIEGLVCVGKEGGDCHVYRMIFRCRGNKGEVFAKVDVSFDLDFGLTVDCFVNDKVDPTYVLYLKPRKIITKIELVEDERIKKIVESIRNGLKDLVV
jgi:hypothetical protein